MWDVHDNAWWHGYRAKSDWARSHGVPVDDTYRLEFYLVDAPFVKVFAYDVNEDGKRHWAGQHNPNECHDHTCCDVARRPPYDLPLNELPPRELLGAVR